MKSTATLAPLLVMATASLGARSAGPSASASAMAKSSAAPSTTMATVHAATSSSAHPSAASSASTAPSAPHPTPTAHVAAAPHAPTKVASLFAPGWAPPAYVAMVKQWHVSGGAKPPHDPQGRPKLVLFAVNRGDRIELSPTSDAGDFSPIDLDRATAMLRAGDGNEHPVDARTLNLVYAIERHFDAPEIRFLSGYRTPHGGASNHGFGRAVDLVVPGATDEAVVEYARTLGFVGVGLYPTSGFIHVDTRDRSFFWVDRSGPGAPNRTVGILPAEAAASDVHARADGKMPSPSTTIGHDVDAALAQRAKVVGGLLPAPSASPSAVPSHADELEIDDDVH